MLRDHPTPIAYWPFEGTLRDLLQSRAIVAAETYPSEFYGHLGLGRVIGKRRHERRKALAPKLRSAARNLGIGLASDLQAQIDDGFGAMSHGEDAFDAFVGMVGMINVISGRRAPGEPRDDDCITTVEGWILGQEAIDIPGT